jgi:mannose-6-phosphate isomerase-like protein (cupin superfamily)
MSSDQQLLQLRKDTSNLGVAESTWREAIIHATPDPVVGIRHAAIAGDHSYRIHIAAIPQQVGCHFHREGVEDYVIVEGEGVLHFGRVTDDSINPLVSPENWRQLAVRAGDAFVIPPGFAHQLRKSGSCDLTLLFGCPDTHLDDSKDRTILPDAPQ